MYYRLKQIDNDGKETLSKVISIDRTNSQKLKVYPTLVANTLTIETDVTGDFQIINVLGQTILSGKTLSLRAGGLDVSALAKGTYILKVGTESAKFMKQ